MSGHSGLKLGFSARFSPNRQINLVSMKVRRCYLHKWQNRAGEFAALMFMAASDVAVGNLAKMLEEAKIGADL